MQEFSFFDGIEFFDIYRGKQVDTGKKKRCLFSEIHGK